MTRQPGSFAMGGADVVLTLDGRSFDGLVQARGWSETLMLSAPLGHALAERDRVSICGDGGRSASPYRARTSAQATCRRSSSCWSATRSGSRSESPCATGTPRSASPRPAECWPWCPPRSCPGQLLSRSSCSLKRCTIDPVVASLRKVVARCLARARGRRPGRCRRRNARLRLPPPDARSEAAIIMNEGGEHVRRERGGVDRFTVAAP